MPSFSRSPACRFGPGLSAGFFARGFVINCRHLFFASRFGFGARAFDPLPLIFAVPKSGFCHLP